MNTKTILVIDSPTSGHNWQVLLRPAECAVVLSYMDNYNPSKLRQLIEESACGLMIVSLEVPLGYEAMEEIREMLSETPLLVGSREHDERKFGIQLQMVGICDFHTSIFTPLTVAVKKRVCLEESSGKRRDPWFPPARRRAA